MTAFADTPIGEMRLKRLREEFGWPRSAADLPAIHALIEQQFDADFIARMLELQPPERLLRDLEEVGSDIRDIPAMPGAGGDAFRNRPRQSVPSTRFYWRQIRGMPEHVDKAGPATGPPPVAVAFNEVMQEVQELERDPDHEPTFSHPLIATAYNILGGADGLKERGQRGAYAAFITTYKDLLQAPRPASRRREPDVSEPTTPTLNSERLGRGLRSVKELLPKIPEPERYPEV